MLDRSSALVSAAAVLISSAPFATTVSAGSAEGPYFGLAAGGISVKNSRADNVVIDYNTGFAIGGQVGYQFRGFRLEGEFAYQNTEGVSGNNVNSNVDIGRFTLGAYADLPIGSHVAPYVGGGFGAASLNANGDFEDQDSGFTWHGEAGVGLSVNDRFVISPFYRYQWIDTDLGGQSEPLVSHLFGVSLRYVLTWHGRSRGDAGVYRSNSYDRGGYGGGYGTYRSYDRYDRYDRDYDDDHDDYHRPRRRPKSPEQEERDRCGWKGPGCEDETSGDWRS